MAQYANPKVFNSYKSCVLDYAVTEDHIFAKNANIRILPYWFMQDITPSSRVTKLRRLYLLNHQLDGQCLEKAIKHLSLLEAFRQSRNGVIQIKPLLSSKKLATMNDNDILQ